MPYDAIRPADLPVLSVRAEIRVREEHTCRTLTLPAVEGETVSIPANSLAAHIIIRGHDFYAVKAEILSTRIGSLLYDGRTLRVDRDREAVRVFCYPNEEEPEEEIRITLTVLPREHT